MIRDIERCYRILELESGASLTQVKQAWRDLVKVWHPDRFPNDTRLHLKAQERLKELNQAYETLQTYLASDQPNTASRPNPAQTRDNTTETEKPPSQSAARPDNFGRVFAVLTALIWLLFFYWLATGAK